MIARICEELGKGMGVPLRCRRAVDVVSAGIIHPEIWRDILSADLVIADITGRNGNVMFELGVAAACLDKERVIIIREDRSDEPRLFDINPARQLDYTRTLSGFQQLASRLVVLIQDGIARAPFDRDPNAAVILPASLDLTTEIDCRKLWGPSGAHRRMLRDFGLEFGSLYNFRYGWLSVGNIAIRNVRVSGEFRFSSPRHDAPYQPWIGIMLRSQGYLASSGHLAVLRADGSVARTQENGGNQHVDIELGQIDDFDPQAGKIVHFDVSIDEAEWRIRMGSVEHAAAISDLPLVFAEGRIIIEGQFCWVCLRKLDIEPL
ncbi:MAG: hypothetical protein IT167_28305 [Bryobacterales bacterium]|nr:hypothetical protein [Bryobacterales bacterium]